MSEITNAVKRIANIARNKNWSNLPAISLIYSGEYQDIPSGKIKPEQLTQEQLKYIDDVFGDFQPYLTKEKIENKVKTYPFKLPQEFYELYQLGNGCLPFDVIDESQNDRKKSSSIYDYFYFPNPDDKLLDLHSIMNFYSRTKYAV